MIETDTAGGVICGYWAIGRLNSAIPPVKVMTIDSTVAKMGRSMKKCEIMARTIGGQLAGGSAVATAGPSPVCGVQVQARPPTVAWLRTRFRALRA